MAADEDDGPKGGYWAIWDKQKGRSYPSAATWIADRLIRQIPDPRAAVLVLGLGGAMIPGNLLCGGHKGKVTVVELCPSVIELCQSRFLPSIFSTGCKRKAALLRIIQGDARNISSFESQMRLDAGAPSAIVVDFPPVYVQPRSMSADWWKRLWSLATPCADFVINTLYKSHDDALLFADELRAAGWTHVTGPWSVANSCGRNGTRSAGRCNRIVTAHRWDCMEFPKLESGERRAGWSVPAHMKSGWKGTRPVYLRAR